MIKIGRTDDFTSKDLFASIGVDFQASFHFMSASQQWAYEMQEDGDIRHPMVSTFDYSWLISRVLLSLQMQYARDETLSQASGLFMVSFQYGDRGANLRGYR